MSNQYTPPSNGEKEEAIRMGIRPAMGDRNTILSVIKNVLETGFDWRQDGGVLTITHPSGTISIEGNVCTFEWV